MDEPLNHLRVPAGTPLFMEDGPGDCAYLIKRGEIEIFIRRGEDRVVLARRVAGEIIGEMALIDSGTRSASAVTITDCELVVLTAQQIRHRIAQTDPILRMCLGAIIQRYRQTLARGAVGRSREASDRTPDRPLTADFNKAMEVLALEGEIERALRDGEFELYFQPIVYLATAMLAGFEALIRWNHPTRGVVSPGEFIPVAEASGLIRGITIWCLREVGRLFPRMAAANRLAGNRAHDGAAPPGELFISVNVSGHDLLDPAFDRTVKTILDSYGVSPRNLKLEITESVLMKDPAGAGLILQACRALGMGIAIDDFGTGYSSLSYLSTLPITTLKIDRAFVRTLTDEGPGRKIVRTIRHLARELDIPVVAEGIETSAQAEALMAMNCEYGQGYFYGEPRPFAHSLDLIAAWSVSPAGRQKSRHVGQDCCV